MADWPPPPPPTLLLVVFFWGGGRGERGERGGRKRNLSDSLRGHEEVGVAVGEVPDGQGDGAEQEEVHGVL